METKPKRGLESFPRRYTTMSACWRAWRHYNKKYPHLSWFPFQETTNYVNGNDEVVYRERKIFLGWEHYPDVLTESVEQEVESLNP